MRLSIPPLALALITAAGCAYPGSGPGAYLVGVPDAVAPLTADGPTTVAPAYRGFCEEHGWLTDLSTDEAGVDRVVAAHNAAYHRVAGSRFWVGTRIRVAGGC